MNGAQSGTLVYVHAGGADEVDEELDVVDEVLVVGVLVIVDVSLDAVDVVDEDVDVDVGVAEELEELEELELGELELELGVVDEELDRENVVNVLVLLDELELSELHLPKPFWQVFASQ